MTQFLATFEMFAVMPAVPAMAAAAERPAMPEAVDT